MTNDKIAEIRARHEIDDRYSGWHPRAHKDRAKLLAEVERLTRERDEARAEVERLRADNERLREVLKIVRIDGPASHGSVWLSFSREGGVRVSFVVIRETASQALLEFEQIRRNALEGKL